MERVRITVRRLEDFPRTLLSEIEGSTLKMRMLAEDLELDHQSDMVQQLGSATKEMVQTADMVKHLLESLQYLASSYQPSVQPTDFKGLLESKVKELEAASPCDPENSRFYKQFKEAVWNVHHAGELMPGQETEDMVMTTSEYGIRNSTCPITGRRVTELEDPVRSVDCQHIYDRKAVLEHIRQKGRRQCQCAIAGCPKVLVAANLVCDHQLLLDLQDSRTRGSSAQEGMQDFTDLEAIPDSIELVDDSDKEST